MKVYTVEEVADLLKVHPEVVRRWLRNGTLEGTRIGRRWYVTEKVIKQRLSGK